MPPEASSHLKQDARLVEVGDRFRLRTMVGPALVEVTQLGEPSARIQRRRVTVRALTGWVSPTAILYDVDLLTSPNSERAA